MSQLMDTQDLFASFNIEELEVLEVSDGVALPQMGASSSQQKIGDVSLCCSSSSSSSTCC